MKVKRSKPTWLLLAGDAIDKMRDMPAKSVHCVVTSPPYWMLRRYFFEGAVVIRNDLDLVTREQIEAELAKLKINPR